MAIQGMQIKTSKKEDQNKHFKELEEISLKLDLTQNEKLKLGELSKKFGVPSERVAAAIFLNNATPNRLNWLKTMALDKDQDSEEKHRFSKTYAIMMEISEQIGFQRGYRNIKPDYLPLVNKIRDSENWGVFKDYSMDY